MKTIKPGSNSDLYLNDVEEFDKEKFYLLKSSSGDTIVHLLLIFRNRKDVYNVCNLRHANDFYYMEGGSIKNIIVKLLNDFSSSNLKFDIYQFDTAKEYLTWAAERC